MKVTDGWDAVASNESNLLRLMPCRSIARLAGSVIDSPDDSPYCSLVDRVTDGGTFNAGVGGLQVKYLTKLKQAEYLGSHPSVPGHRKKVTVEFYDVGVRLIMRTGPVVDVSWSEISGLDADDRDHLESRVTVSRLLLVGIFALAIPKKKIGSYLVIEAVDGTYVLFVPALSSVELGAGLKPLQRYIAAPAQPSNESPALPPIDDVAARLSKLEALRSQQLISEDEYAVKRSAILDSI